MDAKSISNGILRAVGIIVGIVALGYFLYAIRALLLYLGIAAVIALVGRPLVYFLRVKLRVPIILSVITTLLLIISIIVGIVALFIPVISQQSENFGRLDLNKIKEDLTILSEQVSDYLGVEQFGFVENWKVGNVIDYFDFDSIPVFMSSVFGTVGSLVIGVFAVAFASFFFLKDSNLIFNSFLAFAKTKNEARFTVVFNKIKNLLSRYFIGISLQIFVLFVLYTILLFAFDINNFVAIAFICAFLNIVPYIGPVLAGILMVVFVGSDYIGSDFSTVILPNTLYVLVGYIITQIIDNLINQPLIFGQSVKSHPLEIFLIILMSGYIFGIFGMIIAVPTYTAIKVIAKEAFSKYKVVQYLTKGL